MLSEFIQVSIVFHHHVGPPGLLFLAKLAILYRAALEGIAAATRHITDTYRESGAAPSRVMAVGGLMMIQTHPAWPAHELPWDFWRYQQSSFKALLNRFTGFEIIACRDGLPCRILPLGAEGSMRGLMNQPASLGITFRRAIHVSGKPWRNRTGRPPPPAT